MEYKVGLPTFTLKKEDLIELEKVLLNNGLDVVYFNISISYGGFTHTKDSFSDLINLPLLPDKITEIEIDFITEKGGGFPKNMVNIGSRGYSNPAILRLSGEDTWVRSKKEELLQFFNVKSNKNYLLYNTKKAGDNILLIFVFVFFLAIVFSPINIDSVINILLVSIGITGVSQMLILTRFDKKYPYTTIEFNEEKKSKLGGIKVAIIGGLIVYLIIQTINYIFEY